MADGPCVPYDRLPPYRPFATLREPLPPYLVGQLQEESVGHSFQPRPVELRVALERAAVTQERNGSRCRLEGREEIEPEPIELRRRLMLAETLTRRRAGAETLLRPTRPLWG